MKYISEYETVIVGDTAIPKTTIETDVFEGVRYIVSTTSSTKQVISIRKQDKSMFSNGAPTWYLMRNKCDIFR